MISAGAVSKSVELGLKYSEEIKSSWTKLLKDTVNVDGRSQLNVLRTRGDGNTLCPPGALQKYVLLSRCSPKICSALLPGEHCPPDRGAGIVSYAHDLILALNRPKTLKVKILYI